ncbi:VF530 family DNA-binding protein [Undibacterium sp. Di27W]|uniref:VF530 family protein n=1 Tax=Undibacterium sp. Di27W TaxID=3413036 RepID=UPI003BF3385A
MNQAQPSRSLNGITLEAILEQLVAHYGWDAMGKMIDINCFTSDPSIKSSLKFLRKTPWARAKVEELYLAMPG